MLTSTIIAVALSLPAGNGIVIDGDFPDWSDVPVAVSDPADAPRARVDIMDVRVAHDEQFIYLLVETGRVVNVQKLDGRLEVLFDTDGDRRTGATIRSMQGVDLILELTPPDPQSPDRAGQGVGIAVPTDQPPPGDRMRLSGYALSVGFGPTYADDRFELRLARQMLPGQVPFPREGEFAARVDFLDGRGELADRTSDFRYALDAGEPIPIDQPRDPLARPRGTDLRVVSWNAEFGRIFESPAPFARVLAALAPDVILFQELTAQNTAEDLVVLLDRILPSSGGGRWQALLGRGGGDLRCGIAARMPIRPVAALDPLPYPDRPERSVRIAAAELDAFGGRVLLASLHLRCCGSTGSFEDRTRAVEAETIRRALTPLLADGGFDALVMGGDLNLVGSRHPLDVLVESGDLAVANPYQLDGRTNATWADPRLPFAPGRLDFLLYGAGFEALGGFVLDARDLVPRWMKVHGFRGNDTAEASDHLPVVLDLRLAGRR